MRIGAVEAFGVDEQVVDLWQQTGVRELLPIQESALREHGALDGRNLLVFSPTSSGKTFVGEMAAVKTARQGKRVLYLVPQKALAEEKYRDLREKYLPLGVRTVVSTRDRREHDEVINRGDFHIAVVVFEKMQGLLVANPSLLEGVGLVIVDELQMLGDKHRGPGLEILLAKLKLADPRPQIIGLSAVLGNSEELAAWLGAEFCAAKRRPIELRKGVLYDGKLHYVEHNTGTVGHEQLEPVQPDTTSEEALVNQVRAFAEAGEQSLVFCPTKRECIDTAALIARGLPEIECAEAAREFADLEESRNRDILVRLLRRGVAYHNADLDADQRELIERYFRMGGIKVLCATTTLAMGMNLPAKNVFVEPQRWDQTKAGRWMRVPIKQAEYENMGGRAGRLGLEKDFGRAILVTQSQFDARTFWDRFVKGPLGTIAPALDNDPLAHHVLNLVASGVCKSAEELCRVLLGSFTGELHWRGGEKEAAFDSKLKSALSLCLGGHLIRKDEDGGLVATEIGHAAAVKGLMVETAVRLARFARRHRDAAADVHLLEVLLCLNRTDDGSAVYFNLSTDEHRSGRYLRMLKALVPELPEGARGRLVKIDGLGHVGYDASKRIKKALILYEWLTDVPTRDIEKQHKCYAGGIANMAREFSWLAEGLAEIARLSDWAKADVDVLRSISDCLVFGVPAAGVEIARLGVLGLGRGRTVALVRAGLDTCEKIAETKPSELAELVTGPVTERLLDRVKSALERQAMKSESGAADESVEAHEGADMVCEPEAVEVAEAAERDEAVGWSRNVPPKDDMGMPYRSKAKIHIDGQAKDRRHLVMVDALPAWLTERSFEVLLKLALAAKAGGLGWVAGVELGQFGDYYQTIRRLRTDLKTSKANVRWLIRNNRAKHFRLSVPPANVTIGDGLR